MAFTTSQANKSCPKPPSIDNLPPGASRPFVQRSCEDSVQYKKTIEVPLEQIKAHEVETEKLRTEISSYKDKILSYTRDLELKDIELSFLKGQRKTLCSGKEKLTEERDQLKEQQQRNDKIIKDLEKKAESLTSEKWSLRDEISSLKNKLEEEVGKNSSLEKTLGDLRRTLQEKKDSSSQNRKMKNLEDTLERTRQENAEMAETRRELEQKIKLAEDKSEKLSKEVAKLEHTLSQKTCELTILETKEREVKSKLKDTTTEKTALERRENALHSKTEFLTVRNSKLETEMKQLEKSKNALEIRITSSKKQVDEQEQFKQQLILDWDNCQLEVKKLLWENKTLEDENKLAKKADTELQKEISALREDFGQREKVMTEHHKAELERLRQQHKLAFQEQERRHVTTKKSMQSQMASFMKILSEEQQLQRDAVKAMLDRLTQSCNTTDFLNAAYAAYQKGPTRTVTHTPLQPERDTDVVD